MSTVVTRDTIPKDLAERMKRYRLGRDWSLRKAAAVAGISDGSWRNFENGKLPTALTATKMARQIPVLFKNGRRAA